MYSAHKSNVPGRNFFITMTRTGVINASSARLGSGDALGGGDGGGALGGDGTLGTLVLFLIRRVGRIVVGNVVGDKDVGSDVGDIDVGDIDAGDIDVGRIDVGDIDLGDTVETRLVGRVVGSHPISKIHVATNKILI